MPTFTTNYSIPKPVPGADADTWGAALNSGMDIIDTQLAGRVSGASALATVGSVPFVTAAGVLGQSGNLFWDNANGRLNLGSTVRANGQVLNMYESGNIRYGIGVATSALRLYNPGTGNNTVFGTVSTADGSTFAEQMRLVGGTGNLLLGTTTDDGTNRLQVAGNMAATGVVRSTQAGRAQLSGSNSRGSLELTDSAGANGLNTYFNGSVWKYESANNMIVNIPTVQFQDERATVGSTSLVVRAGAGQGGNDLTQFVTLASGTSGVRSNGVIYGGTSVAIGTVGGSANPFGVLLGSGADLRWSNAAAFGAGTPDASLSRASANTLQVGDGGANANGTINAARVNVGTNATVPLLIGGTGVLSTLTLRSTSGVGTTGADIIFQTGSNGATEAMRILNGGNVGIGTASPASRLHVLTANPTAANEMARFQGGTNLSNFRNYVSFYTTNPNFWWELSNEDSAGTGSANGLAFRERSSSDPSLVRMYLAAGGNVGIGSSTASRKLTVYEGTAGTADVGVRVEHVSNKPAYMEFVTTQRTASFGLGNFSGAGFTGSMQLVCDGGFHVCPSGTGNFAVGLTNPSYQLQISTDSAAKPSTNTWTIASDARLKTVLGDYEKGLDAICALRPVRYEYNGLGGMVADGKEHISILAQEAQEVFPECIGTFVGKLHEDDEEETELLNYNGHAVTFAFINAIKELKARIETLEAAQK